MTMMAIVLGSSPLIFLSLFLVTEEKCKGIMNLMHQMHLMESAYWLALFLRMAVLACLSLLFISLLLQNTSILFEGLYSINFAARSYKIGKLLIPYLWPVIFVAQMSLISNGALLAAFLQNSKSVNFAYMILTITSILCSAQGLSVRENSAFVQ
jgi:hypothetical protein